MLCHPLRAAAGNVGNVDDITNYVYNNVQFDLNTNNARGLCISSDGAYIYYTTSQASNYLRSLVMSTPYDLSTASLSNSDTAPTEPQGISVNTAGTQFHISRDASDGIQYGTASTAFNISTVGSLSTFSVSSQTTTPQGHSFGDDGYSLYVYGNGNSTFYQYTLTTPFNLTTASYASKTFTDANFTSAIRTISFNLDGTKFYVLPSNTTSIFQYNLTSPWDISTASYTMSLSVSGVIPYNGRGVIFSNDMTRMYVMSSNGTNASALNEYIRN